MSATRSSHQLRDEVHAELTALLAADGPLFAPPESVSACLTDDFVQDTADQYWQLGPPGAAQGRAMLVTAGAPGAGKSTAVAELAPGYRRIDPDAIKDFLLLRLESAGLLGARHQHTLSDERPVSPGELSIWTHRASTDAADLVRQRCLLDGENFVMEGTLAWQGLTDIYVDELILYDYQQVRVLAVEVPVSTAIAQARGRWWDSRHGETVLGGRFLSDETIAAFYSPEGASVCSAHARDLYQAANESHIEADLALVSRDHQNVLHTALVTPSGEVTAWPVPGGHQEAPTGAACTHCGRVLTSTSSIVEGVGRSCG